MTSDFDIAVVGSGFGGALAAMIARRVGRSVVLIERWRHPRFAVGESSTPLSNLLLEQIAREYDLPRLLPLCEWGRWRAAYPQIRAGLKRGFTFYHHAEGRRFSNRDDRGDQLLVAASPCDALADTHWLRADVDAFFVRQAIDLGVEYLDETRLGPPIRDGSRWTLEGTRHGRPVRLSARFIIDATGPRGFLHQSLSMSEEGWPALRDTCSLYSHFEGVRPTQELAEFRTSQTLPYPPDAAAVHHVFDGGWVWVLRFENGLSSAGVVADRATTERFDLRSGPAGWRRLLDAFPSIADQLSDARAVRDFTFLPSVTFRTARAAGDGFLLLPSAAGFVDPMLSTGFPLTILGVRRIGELLKQEPGSARFETRLAEYESRTLAELDAAADLVSALYAQFGDFELFSPLTMLYFAAASFAESAMRLGETPYGFLLHDHPQFGPSVRACTRMARQPDAREAGPRRALLEAIARAVEPINVAGLNDPARKNWYPVDLEDLRRCGWKLSNDPGRIEALIAQITKGF